VGYASDFRAHHEAVEARLGAKGGRSALVSLPPPALPDKIIVPAIRPHGRVTGTEIVHTTKAYDISPEGLRLAKAYAAPGNSLAANLSPHRSTAQAIRAGLLAKATTATFLWTQASKPFAHRPRAVSHSAI
jgi:hypothetical protein